MVPVGLTKFREGLQQLEPFTKEDSLEVLSIIHKWQRIFQEHYNTRLVYGSDEWYIKAELPLPEDEEYEDYHQLENGVGLIRTLQMEFDAYYDDLQGDDRVRSISVATGVLAAPYLSRLSDKLKLKFPNIKVQIYTIVNHYFGPEITVAGLITGNDIITQLKSCDLGESLLIPDIMLRSNETVLLDDVTVKDMEKALQTPIRIVQSDGKSFIDSIIM